MTIELDRILGQIRKTIDNASIPWKEDDAQFIHEDINKPQKANLKDKKMLYAQNIPINGDAMVGKSMTPVGSHVIDSPSTHEQTFDREHGHNRLGETQEPILKKSGYSNDSPKVLNDEECDPIISQRQTDAIHKILDDAFYKSNLIPVLTIIHYKSGRVKTSIRWKKPESIGVKRVESKHELIGVIPVEEGPYFTHSSKLRQTMFFLADSIDIDKLYNNEFLPIDSHEKYGDGLYLYNDLERAKKKNEEEHKTVLPVKINIGNPYLLVNNTNWNESFRGNLVNLGYDSIMIPTGVSQVFDILVFNPKLVRVLGEDSKSESISKSFINQYESEGQEECLN